MKRVICGRPNASTLISGVRFSPMGDGRYISDEIDDATADMFLDVSGYSLAEEQEADKKKKEQAALDAALAAEAKKQAAAAKKLAAEAKKLAAEQAANPPSSDIN